MMGVTFALKCGYLVKGLATVPYTCVKQVDRKLLSSFHTADMLYNICTCIDPSLRILCIVTKVALPADSPWHFYPQNT